MTTQLISIQHGVIDFMANTRQNRENTQIGMENVDLCLFEGDMILYIENSKNNPKHY